MIVDSTGSKGAIVGAIRNAAQATGANFQYLLATAQVESGFNPTASVSTSSAKGLFQFIDQTWLATVKQAGPQLGYGRYANAIEQTAGGTYTVSDPAMRREILALRDDPVANAAMAGAFTQQNAALLKERIGRDASEGELYIAHFMGAGGGAQLINLAEQNPGATAATAFPGAAKANPSIFYDRQGHARTAADVYHVLVARYDVARAAPTVSMAAASTSATMSAAATPPAAIAAPAMTAQLATPATPATVTVALPSVAASGPVFHSLFSDTHRQPVSQIVQDLWTTNPRVASALTGQGGPPAAASATQPAAPNAAASNGTMDLFSDRPADVRALFGERT
jgi:hypothetical protein